MNDLYHIVPRNFTGSVLYPLNELQHRFPEVYEAHIEKYEGREVLLEREIPILNCLWNDVLHFSPVHPKKTREALLGAGFQIKTTRWFEIDPTAFDFNASNTVIYWSPKRARGDFSINKADFEPYSHSKLKRLSGLPSATIAHFEEAKEQGERPFLFNYIPHVLFRGTIETENAEVIQV